MTGTKIIQRRAERAALFAELRRLAEHRNPAKPR